MDRNERRLQQEARGTRPNEQSNASGSHVVRFRLNAQPHGLPPELFRRLGQQQQLVQLEALVEAAGLPQQLSPNVGALNN